MIFSSFQKHKNISLEIITLSVRGDWSNNYSPKSVTKYSSPKQPTLNRYLLLILFDKGRIVRNIFLNEDDLFLRLTKLSRAAKIPTEEWQLSPERKTFSPMKNLYHKRQVSLKILWRIFNDKESLRFLLQKIYWLLIFFLLT